MMGLEGGQLDDGTRVVPWGQPDGLGDESTIPNGMKVCFETCCQDGAVLEWKVYRHTHS